MPDPRDQLSEIASYFYRRGWMLGTAGNLSVRNPDGTIWITASGQNKGELNKDSETKSQNKDL